MICIGCGSFSYFVSKYAHACSITATFQVAFYHYWAFFFLSFLFSSFFLVFLYTDHQASDLPLTGQSLLVHGDHNGLATIGTHLPIS